VAGVLLRGPFVVGFPDQDVGRFTTDDLLQPRRCAAQPDAEIRILLDGEREFELAIEPGRDVVHPLSLVSMLCFVAVIATYLPARRAANVNPLVALRQD